MDADQIIKLIISGKYSETELIEEVRKLFETQVLGGVSFLKRRDDHGSYIQQEVKDTWFGYKKAWLTLSKNINSIPLL